MLKNRSFDCLLGMLYPAGNDEHGGCYDHVLPPSVTPPGGPNPDGFDFSSFGVRVPAVIVSPYARRQRHPTCRTDTV
jgi:phospholipase C